jgi:hypothetical protein
MFIFMENYKICIMKKVFVALSLMLFVGSLTTTAFAASNDNNVEIKKDEKKKKKSKKGGSCCAAKTAETKSCGTVEKKACHTENK